MKKIIASSLLVMMLFSCGEDEYSDIDFKEEMRDFVIEISEYSKGINTGFIIIPQNGQELVTLNGDESDPPHSEYIESIDGVGREDLFYGYDNDDVSTPENEKEYMVSFLDLCISRSVTVLVTDYCWTQTKMDDSYLQNNLKGYISFAAPSRELDVIPTYPAQPYNVNSDDISSLDDAKNFLYILNPQNFVSSDDFVNAILQTNFDLIIIDLFFDDLELTPSQVNALKYKANGGKRLVISYMSIGEAEDYRYYWVSSWNNDPPNWLKSENPDWEGNYKVKYWDSGWKEIIFGNDESYLKRIIDAGFDGVYLDIIDAFEYFES